ncbi:pyridoxal phosphate-dependent decarboxylase family protein [Oceanicella actignis]|uniref:Glutamate or tyrosine decarboxylase n=1 Tax=Oceanicella actignis TaxID=1189325 RepID=A0A1M7S1Z9_9RHOB|nr:pyridoxal-dependent decarboxylase [Oceanicella actignis]SES90332.1 Glutamate or tyrosine decarboxylase [Oceanicella actignis]SHN52669.1 Glutamate or tyrosine decarboxylase [Oceanicella actignis]
MTTPRPQHPAPRRSDAPPARPQAPRPPIADAAAAPELSDAAAQEALRARMFAQLEDKGLFRDAAARAFAYLDTIMERRVFPDDAALAGLAAFDAPLPERGAPAEALIELLDRAGSPATVAQLGGRYFGFVNGSALPPALAARWLTDVWDQNPALHVISPVLGRIEATVEAWLAQLLGLPRGTAAGFVSGSSTAIFAGLAAARWRLLGRAGWDVNRKGLAGAPALRVVAGEQAHGTVAKAAQLLGLGLDNVERVPADAEGRIRADLVPELDERTILILQAGNVNSGAFDDFADLCARARAAGAWTHVDGAFGLWAAATRRFAHLTRGVELADSWSVDGHKTLNTPYDCGIALCADPEALIGAMQTDGAYIHWSAERDGMRTTPEMSRRARAVELWAALAFLGREGVETLLGALHDNALRFADALRAAGFEVLNEVVFNQVLVACGDDARTEAVMRRVQREGEAWAGGTTWRGCKAIRISVCSWATRPQDVDRAAAAFARALRAEGG